MADGFFIPGSGMGSYVAGPVEEPDSIPESSIWPTTSQDGWEITLKYHDFLRTVTVTAPEEAKPGATIIVHLGRKITVYTKQEDGTVREVEA